MVFSLKDFPPTGVIFRIGVYIDLIGLVVDAAGEGAAAHVAENRPQQQRVVIVAEINSEKIRSSSRVEAIDLFRTHPEEGEKSKPSVAFSVLFMGTQIHVPNCYIHKPVYQEVLHGDQLRFMHPECFAFLLRFDKLYQQIQDFIPKKLMPADSGYYSHGEFEGVMDYSPSDYLAHIDFIITRFFGD
uniref:Uncharacterized protein n=1 Tax=Oryza sativa subsp. japonica TaxID=39947 RepID=Q655N2_ORYSJ|nr:hypothetical protein [Oryza sativa Japonica Group]